MFIQCSSNNVIFKGRIIHIIEKKSMGGEIKWASNFSWGHITYYNLTTFTRPWPDRTATNSLFFIFDFFIFYSYNWMRRSRYYNLTASDHPWQDWTATNSLSIIYYFYFYIIIEWIIYLYIYYIFIYLDCSVFSRTWKQHAWDEGIGKRGI